MLLSSMLNTSRQQRSRSFSRSSHTGGRSGAASVPPALLTGFLSTLLLSVIPSSWEKFHLANG